MSSIIFGPLLSRRFGKSLGIDLSPNKKQCNFDCLYCELKPAKTVDRYDDIISVDNIMHALQEALSLHKDIDVITITANGEPTLYPYLGKLINRINDIKGNIKTLILSNGSTIGDLNVREALAKLDMVKLSLDCANDKCLKKLDRAHEGLNVADIMQGMLDFKAIYDKPLIIEVLLVKSINDNIENITALNHFLTKLNPTRVDVGTIDRPPAYKVEALSYDELKGLVSLFDLSLPVYIVSRKTADKRVQKYTNDEIIQTLSNRPLSSDDIEILFDEDTKHRLKDLLNSNKIKIKSYGGVDFYKLP
ncbi:putative MoaA/NifB/PqqE family protein, Radical SAM domain protein [Sulfurovum sp. enrichment culture clone C5]|uniref:Putative MoaA/NifB/PqqE family protein, Radical SAM domain protein n=1 Tax=Sulfurovum sp. enrichment culture clone C5 TaxID=497650 RepID=A0A0S4XQD2_9BACT|nr:putative MoaA/NifB/PqqE family protein, Radical SAM domain protein [Sulfurovum sp. enrichment culture clone C5]